MNKDRASDPQVLACLGRVFLLKGKQDKSAAAMKTSLDYSRRALALAPSQLHFKFNIAFVQVQLAQLMHTLPDSQRTLMEVQAASEGLDAAVDALTEIAQAPNPPYPKHDIEQRANMGRNTMRKQLERDIEQQRTYEEKNAARLEEAKRIREAAAKRREEEAKKADALALQKKQELLESRNEILKVSRELAAQRAEEDRQREEMEYTTDEETGERVKRKKKPRSTARAPRKRKGDETDTAVSGAEGEEYAKPRRRRSRKSVTGTTDTSMASTGDEKPKKRRKLARKSEQKSKFKSSEFIEDSDLDDDDGIAAPNAPDGGATAATPGDSDVAMRDVAAATGPNGTAASSAPEDEDDEEEVVARPRAKGARKRVAESDDEE